MPGRVLLNGNAESATRLATLARNVLQHPRHRDPQVRENGPLLVVTGAWGAGERNDGPVREALQRVVPRAHPPINLELYTFMRMFLARRPVVDALYKEHLDVGMELAQSYNAENDATVGLLRDVLSRSQSRLEKVSLPGMLAMGDQPPPGPPTRPVDHLLRVELASQLRRSILHLQLADDRHSVTLEDLWAHFHLAAGLEFDDLWLSLRRRLADRILGSSAVVLLGGSPFRLLEGLRFFQLAPVLAEALRRGTDFLGTSAGAMSLGRRVVVFHDKRQPRQEFSLLDTGMGLVHGLQVFPHVTDRVQTEDMANLAYLAARFRHRACVGLNAGSLLMLEAVAGSWFGTSLGDEDVVVFGHDGTKHRYPLGAPVPEVGLEPEPVVAH